MPPGGQLGQLAEQYFTLQLTAAAVVGGLFLLLGPGVSLVTESARAHSYYPISTGMQIGHPRLYHFWLYQL